MPERQPNLWAEQEARETGLDTYPALKTKLARIDTQVSLVDHFYKEALLEVPAHKVVDVPKTVEAVYIEEFREDVSLLLFRLEKLQLNLLKELSAGSLRYLQNNGDRGVREKLNRKTSDHNLGQLGVSEHLNKLPEKAQEQIKVDFYLSALYRESPKDQKLETLTWLNSGFNAVIKDLQQILDQKLLFEDSSAEEKLRRCKKVYRNLLRQFALVLSQDSWNSPTYAASGRGQRAEDQSSEPFLTDYQRNHYRELVYFQNKELAEYTGFRAREELNHVDHLLFNNGFSAFTCMAQAIKNESKLPRYKIDKNEPIVISTPVYFEVDQIFDATFDKKEILKFEKPSEDELIEAIKIKFPLAVVLAPLANNYELRTIDIEKVLEGLCDERWVYEFHKKFRNTFRDITLIIDNTLVGREAKWKDFDFRRLPTFVKIWAGESLIKYAQDGQEFSQGGLVTCIGEYSEDPLQRVRRISGSVPTKEMVDRMSILLDQEVTDHRYKRHSRNTKLVAEHILKRLPKSNSFIKEVNFAADAEGKALGGVFTIGVDMSSLENPADELWYLDYKNFVSNFCRTVITLAKEAGIELNMGTSFGFDSTRLASYEKDKNSRKYNGDQYFVRVAVGTENASGALLVAECIARANDIFSEALKRGRFKKMNNLEPDKDLKFNKKTPN